MKRLLALVSTLFGASATARQRTVNSRDHIFVFHRGIDGHINLRAAKASQ